MWKGIAFPPEQLCWKCKKACGGCSWSESLTPIDGWTAEKRVKKYNLFGEPAFYETYEITGCPEFVHDGKRH